MKISISEFGMITLVPENAWEDFALRIWKEKASIEMNDQARMVDHYIHPGYIRIEPFQEDL